MFFFSLEKLLDKSDQDWQQWKEAYPKGVSLSKLQHFYRSLDPSDPPEVLYRRTQRLIELKAPLQDHLFLETYSLQHIVAQRKNLALWLEQGVKIPWNRWADEFGAYSEQTKPSHVPSSHDQGAFQDFFRVVEFSGQAEQVLPILMKRIHRDLQDLQRRIKVCSGAQNLLRRKHNHGIESVQFYTAQDAMASLRYTTDVVQALLRKPSLDFDSNTLYHSDTWQAISTILKNPNRPLQNLPILDELRQIEERWALSLTVPKASSHKTSQRL